MTGEKSEGVPVSAKRELSKLPYRVEAEKPLNRRLSVHACKVTYGGVNGAYYTSTRTTKSGADGVSNAPWLIDLVIRVLVFLMIFVYDQVVIEETKEADKTTGQAQHRISRGIHNKVE